MPGAATTKVISVGGGKGGVGKSLVSCNLAVAMAQAGARVVLVDADLGAANQHTLLGIDRPGPTLQALFDRTIDRLEQALVPTGIPGLQLVPGSGAVVGAANVSATQKLKLIRHLRELPADIVIVDVGAGVAFNVVDLYLAAELRLLVVTPELTSMQNAYAFAKGAVFRELGRLAVTEPQRELVTGGPEASETTRRMGELLARVDAADPALGIRLREGLDCFGARLVGNLVFDPKERGGIHAIGRMMRDFLGIEAPVLGAVRSSKRVHDTVRTRRPYVLANPNDEISASFRAIAATLLREPSDSLRQARAQLEGSFGPPTPSASPTSLPEALERYTRKDPRVAVRCKAMLRLVTGPIEVELRDVSLGGALLELDAPPAPDTRAVLVAAALEDRPALPCIVRHAGPRRAGVQFDGESSVVKSAVTRLVERFGGSQAS
jgi:flagellar biosynthesis protein FlhG